MAAAWDTVTLVVCLALPFTLTLTKRRLIHAKETQLFDYSGQPANGGTQGLWKPHKKLRSFWAVIYILMGLATWRVVRRGGIAAQSGPLMAYALLLVAKALAWPPLFLGGHSMPRAIVESSVLATAVITTVTSFHRVDHTAAYLLLPFVGWTLYATMLLNCSFQARHEVVEEAVRWSALKRVRPHARPSPPPRSPAPTPSLRMRQGVAHEPVMTPFQKPTIAVPATEATPPLPSASRKMSSRAASEEGDMSPTTLNRLGTFINRVSDQVRVTGASGLSQTGVLFKSLSSRVSDLVASGPLSPGAVAAAKTAGPPKLPSSPTSDSIPLHYFSCPGSAGFKVRGRDYLTDKQKWVPPSPDFTLFAMDLLSVPEPTYHIARFLPSVRESRLPFHFLWQVMVPGQKNISLTITWVLDHDPIAAVQQVLAGGAGDRFTTAGDELDVPEGSDRSFDSVATDSGAPGTRSGDGGAVERSAHSSSAAGGGAGTLSAHRRSGTSLAEAEGAAFAAGRHRRAATQLDGSETPQKATQPSGGWWGSGGTPAKTPATANPNKARSTEDPDKYAGCNPLDVALMRFLEAAGEGATDEENARERHSQFKIIPRIEEGGWIVKSAVGQNTPVLLGRKITTKYFRGPNYIEVDVDVSSSRSAAHVVGLVQGALKSLVIDIAILLEGRSLDELPEKLLGTVRLQHLDLSAAGSLDISTGLITRKPE